MMKTMCALALFALALLFPIADAAQAMPSPDLIPAKACGPIAVLMRACLANPPCDMDREVIFRLITPPDDDPPGAQDRCMRSCADDWYWDAADCDFAFPEEGEERQRCLDWAHRRLESCFDACRGRDCPWYDPSCWGGGGGGGNLEKPSDV